jgi:hypothetical protein
MDMDLSAGDTVFLTTPGDGEAAAADRRTEWRRIEWFHQEIRDNGGVSCRVCLTKGGVDSLELHSLSYSPATGGVDRWSRDTPHDHLVPLCPQCHVRLHVLLRERADSDDPATAFTANRIGIRQLQALFKLDRTQPTTPRSHA